MSSRLSVPVSKLTRSISTTPAIARPSHVLNNGSKSATAAAARKRQQPQVAEELGNAETTRSAHTAAAPHRPSAIHARTVPLMQGFRTSVPKPVAALQSTIDTAVLPDLWSAEAEAEASSRFYIRVPLLPDNDAPPAGTHAPEATDMPLPRAQISVVAANPHLVLPSALTEVEGMGVDGVELSFAHELHREEEAQGQGMVRDIWKGLMDDVFGEKKVAV